MEKAKRIGNIISNSEEDTLKAGEEFAKKLKPGDIVLLYGNLGFGKTTFVKGVGKGLGIKKRIISPTFTVIRAHDNTYHIDLYRIESKNELFTLGIKDVLDDRESIKLIEWPEKLNILPKKRIEVKIVLNNNNTRSIFIDEYV